MTPTRLAPVSRSGEFFAPLPLLFVGLLIVNDYWGKPRFHNDVTGKLSDLAVCFFMPLFCSELLGLAFRLAPRVRLGIAGLATALIFATLEVVPPVTDAALLVLTWLGPVIGVERRFVMTSDPTDLYCLLVIPLAIGYGQRRLRCRAAASGSRQR